MTRKRPPSVDFYYDDFLAGVSEMHPLAIGFYIKTICFQWGHDFVPFERQKLLRILGATEAEFNEFWPEVQKKLVPVDGQGWINVRAQAAMDKKLAVASKRSECGRKGGRPRGKQKVSVCLSKTKAKKKQMGRRKKEVGRRKKEDGSGKLEVSDTATSETQESNCFYSPEFEAFWAAFPRGRRKSKGKAFEEYEKAIAFVDHETLLRRAQDYAESAEGRGKYVKMPSTWLHQHCWDDDDASWDGNFGISEREERSLFTIDKWVNSAGGSET